MILIIHANPKQLLIVGNINICPVVLNPQHVAQKANCLATALIVYYINNVFILFYL